MNKKIEAWVKSELDEYSFQDLTLTEIARAIVKHPNSVERIVLALELFWRISQEEQREFLGKFKNYLSDKYKSPSYKK